MNVTGTNLYGEEVSAPSVAEWLSACRASERERKALVKPPQAMTQAIAVLDGDAPARTRLTVPAMPYGVTGGKVESA